MREKTKALAFVGLLIIGVILASLGIVNTQSITQGGAIGLLLFFIIVVVEVVIAPIPGGVIGFLGAGTYGFWKSWPIMYFGNLIGCIISFWLARKLGKPYVDKTTSKKQRNKWTKIFEKNRVWLYAAYSVPLVPIDVLSILAGFTKYDFKTFLKTVAPALVSYTAITAFAGSRLGEYIPYIETIMLVAGALFFTAFIALIIREIWRAKK